MIHAEEPHVRRMLAERYKKEGKEGLILGLSIQGSGLKVFRCICMG